MHQQEHFHTYLTSSGGITLNIPDQKLWFSNLSRYCLCLNVI